MTSESSCEEEVIVMFAPEEDICSEKDPPMSEWSSLLLEHPEENRKMVLHAQGLYSPGSGEVCLKYIAMSDSTVLRHPYYNYPAIVDPGIIEALKQPEKVVKYKEDGQDLYMAVCEEMKICPVRLFYRCLLTREIDLSYYGINPKTVRAMAIALQHNKTVRRFDLTDNYLDNDSCYHLAQMLKINTSIKELILTGCRIGLPGIRRLGSTLSVNRSLELLDLSANCLGENGGEQFAEYIGKDSAISHVILRKNDLGMLTALALAQAFEYRNELTHLDLSWNNFSHGPSLLKMLNELTNSQVLQELILAWNAIEDERVARALSRIMLIPSLQVLNLSNNRFRGKSLVGLLRNLFKATKLVTLDLSYNSMSSKDAYLALEKMLNPDVKLKNLHLEGIAVEKNFLTLLDSVMNMTSRKAFKVTYGQVVRNYTVEGPDPRRLIMERMDYLGKKDKKKVNPVDVALFFLGIGKDSAEPMTIKELLYAKKRQGVPLDEDLVSELALVFAGPKQGNLKTVDIQLICDYIHRIWPERKLPPTPPPEPAPPPPPVKGKKKGKK